METVLAMGPFKIVAHNGRHGLFMENKEMDWFPTYNEALNLAQNLMIGVNASENDPMVGTKKFCPSSVGNGQLVIVVGKSANGYRVQPVGKTTLMEVSKDFLSDPPGDYR